VQPHGSTAEVQFLGNRDEVAKMPKLHVHTQSIWIDTNEILDVSIKDHDTDGVDLNLRPLKTAADADAFRILNEEWIAQHFVIEEQDRRQLDDPVAAYLDTGGEILIAELDGQPIGCVALVPDGTGAYELSKMAISTKFRGRGAGRTLLTAAIDHAQRMGARSLFLGSSKKLPDAVHLYETVGFQHVAPETIHMPYARADVFMQLTLPQTASLHPHG